MAGYRVTAPLVIAHRDGGTSVHVYEGGFLPDDVSGAQLEQLLASEMVTADAGSGDEDGKRSAKKPARVPAAAEE